MADQTDKNKLKEFKKDLKEVLKKHDVELYVILEGDIMGLNDWGIAVD